MEVKKIMHNGEKRIQVDFPYNQKIASRLKQINDASWSKASGAWHIPYSKEAYNQLIQLFPDIKITKHEIIENVIPLPSEQTKPNKNEISVEVSGKSISLKIPKNEADIQFVRTFKYARWDYASYRWTIPNYGQNLEQIKDYFKGRINRIENILLEGAKSRSELKNPPSKKVDLKLPL